MSNLARVAFVIAVMLAGVAFAQDQRPAPFVPEYSVRPVGGSVRYFPSAAMRQGFVGVVALCCRPQDDGKLRCRVGYEWPRDLGLGASALRLSERYTWKDTSVAAFRNSGRTDYNFRIPFVVAPLTAERKTLLDRVTAISSLPEVCAASERPMS